MNEPKRLRDGSGPASMLMTGERALRVPSASRRRALAFTGTAAGLAASTSTVVGSAASLVKSFAFYVCLGAAGGGVMSLAASETVKGLQPPANATDYQPARTPSTVTGAHPAVELPAAPSPAVAPPVETIPPPASVDLAAREPTLRRAVAPNGAGGNVERTPAPRAKQAGVSLFEEQRFVESARAAVARGDAREALGVLDSYDRAFARKQFGPEALALRIEALRASGQVPAANTLASDFARRYPDHPLLARVRGGGP